MPTFSKKPDPVSRCHTALFRLAVRAIPPPERECDRSFWSNHPGQNTVEAYTLAGLLLLLTGGACAVAVLRITGWNLWGVLVALPAGVLLAFLGLHLIVLAFLGVFTLLGRLGLRAPPGTSRCPVAVYLFFFTAIAILLAASGNPALVGVSAPWLLWAFLNLGAWVILRLIDRTRPESALLS